MITDHMRIDGEHILRFIFKMMAKDEVWLFATALLYGNLKITQDNNGIKFGIVGYENSQDLQKKIDEFLQKSFLKKITIEGKPN